MKKQLISLSMILSALVAVVLMLSNNDDKDKKIETLYEKVQAYNQYYRDTETLLDSLLTSDTSEILETDCGSTYLNSKYTLDSLMMIK